jgi:hypothetical protein
MSWEGGQRAWLYDRASGVWRLESYGATSVLVWSLGGATGLPTTERESEGYVAHDPSTTSRVYVTTASKVYRLDNANTGTVDAGTINPVDITGPISKPGPVVVGPTGNLYVCQRASAGGVAKLYRSTNQGTTWSVISDNYYDRNAGSVFSLDVSSDEYIYVGTNGMGTFVGTPPPTDPPDLVRPFSITSPPVGTVTINVGTTGSTINYDTDSTMPSPFNTATLGLLTLNNSTDYIIRLPDRIFEGKMIISGGRHVCIVGGRIRLGYKSSGLPPTEGAQSYGACAITIQGGAVNRIVHIEGVRIDSADGGTQSDAVQVNSSNTILQLLNCRIVNLQGALEQRHADVLQSAGGYKEIRIQGCTFSSHYDNLYLRRETNGSLGPEMGPLIISRTNCFGYTTNPLGDAPGITPQQTFYALAIGTQPSTVNGGAGNPGSDQNCDLTQPVWLHEFYGDSDTTGKPLGQFMYPHSKGPTYGSSAMTALCRAQEDATGSFADWPYWRTEHSPPTGAKVFGVIHKGPPPGGDFAKAADTGLSYSDFWAFDDEPPPPPPSGIIVSPRRWRKNNLPVYYRLWTTEFSVDVNDKLTVAAARQAGRDFEIIAAHWQNFGTGQAASDVIDALKSGGAEEGHEVSAQLYVNGTFLEKARAPKDPATPLPDKAYTRAAGDTSWYLADNGDTYLAAPFEPEYFEVGEPGRSLLEESLLRLGKASPGKADGVWCDNLGIGIIGSGYNARVDGSNPPVYQSPKTNDTPYDPATKVSFASSNTEQGVWLDHTVQLGAWLRDKLGTAAKPVAFGVNGGSSGERYFGNPSMVALLEAGHGLTFEGWLRSATSALTVWPTETVLIEDLNAIIDVQRRGKYAMVWTKLWSVSGGYHAGHDPIGDSAGTPNGVYANAEDDNNNPTVVQWHRLFSGCVMLASMGNVFAQFVHDKAGGNQRVPKDRWFDHLNAMGAPTQHWLTAIGANGQTGGITAAKGADGLYKRDFQFGRVVVNPTVAAVNHSLPTGTWLDVDDGSSAASRTFGGGTSVSIPAQSARMLLKTSATNPGGGGGSTPTGPTVPLSGTSIVKMQGTGSASTFNTNWNSPVDYTTYDATNGTGTAWTSTAPNINYTPTNPSATPLEAVEVGATTPPVGIVWRGGIVIGQLPHNLTWDQAKSSAGGTGIRIKTGGPAVGIPSQTYEYIRMHNTVDGLKTRDSVGKTAGVPHSTFLVRHCYFTAIRDDCIENDDFLQGSISDCLFDGVWTFLSEQNQGTTGVDFYPQGTGEDPNCYIDKVYVRLALTNVEIGAGKWFKYQDEPGDFVHNPVVTNSVFAVEQEPRLGGWASLNTANVTWGTGNAICWLGPPGGYGGPLPSGVAFHDSTTPITADTKWRTVRNQWLIDHGYTSQGTLAANYDPKTNSVAPLTEVRYP